MHREHVERRRKREREIKDREVERRWR